MRKIVTKQLHTLAFATWIRSQDDRITIRKIYRDLKRRYLKYGWGLGVK